MFAVRAKYGQSGSGRGQDERPPGILKVPTLVFCLFVLSGCQFGHRPPPPLQNPMAKLSVDEYSGSSLSGPLGQSAEQADLASAWSIQTKVFAVKTLPQSGFDPVGPLARLILNDGRSELITPSTRLTYSARIRILKPKERFDTTTNDPSQQIDLGTLLAHVAPGTTAAFNIAQPAASIDSSNRQRISVEIDRAKGEDGYDLSLTSFDRQSSGAMQVVREMLVIHRLPSAANQDHVALGVPMNFTASKAAGIVIDVSIDTRAPDARSIAELKTKLDASASSVAEKLKAQPQDAADLDVAAALNSLARTNDSPRASLAYLTQISGARLSESVVLVADRQLLLLISKAIREAIPRLAARDRHTVGWMLDRATIKTISSLKEDQAAQMLPPVQGALETFAGQAGYELDVLQSLADKSTSSSDLYNHLVAEHLIYLEDNSAAARVRAFDWLRARGAAPPGYDPLASNRARREALDKMQEAATQPAQ